MKWPPRPPRRPAPDSRVADRIIGIVIGLILGLAIVIFFVFVLSKDAIDDPGLPSDTPTQTRPAPTGP